MFTLGVFLFFGAKSTSSPERILPNRRPAQQEKGENTMANIQDENKIPETVDVSSPDYLEPIDDAPVGLGDAPVRRRASKADMRLRKTIAASLFAALAYLCVFVIHIKVAGFLTFDFKDAVMALGSLWLGPVAGVLIAAVVAFFEFISVSSTGPYGLLMNFASSASFILPAAILFRLRRTRRSAMIGLGISVVFMLAVMMPLNILIDPLYLHVSRETVLELIPPTLLPFNLIKGVLNAALVAMLFQPVRRALNSVRILPPDEEPRRLPAWVIPVAAGVLAVAACLVFFLVLDGKFQLFR